jgi:uncharacterized protein involved in outer membrane biogenesis
MPRRTILIAGAGLAAVVLLLAAALWRKASSLERPEVQAALLERLSQAAGTEIRARRLEVSVLSGLRLEGVTVANPAPFTGYLLSADALVLRHRLLPLLRGRLEIDALSVEKPALRLAMDARGTSNLDALLSRRPPARSSAVPAPIPLRLVVRRGSLKDASFEMRDHRGRLVAAAENVGLESTFEADVTSMGGRGRATIGRASAGGAVLQDIVSEVLLSKALVHLSDVRGRLAEGVFKGDLKLQVQDSSFEGTFGVEGARVEELLGPGPGPRPLSGRLQATGELSGRGGASAVRGRGRADVSACRAERSALLAAVSTALRLPELAQPELTQCEVHFTLAGPRLTTTPVRLKGAAFDLAGRGVTNLESRAIDYDLVLALPHGVLARVPTSEMRAAFKDRGDGFASLDFKATGTMEAPRTDIATRLARGAALETARKGLGRLLRGEKPF